MRERRAKNIQAIMAQNSTRERLKKAAIRRVDEYYALATLACMYDAGAKAERAITMSQIAHATNRRLATAEAMADEAYRDLAQKLGATRKPQEYVSILTAFKPASNQYSFVPKWKLKTLFPKLESFNPGLRTLPEHAELQMDVQGIRPRNLNAEVRINEATLFEDMCALLNQAWDLQAAEADPNCGKPVIKQAAAARRGAALAAFYFVEAYLNSIAFDYVMQESTIAAATLDLLSEWDHAKNRQKLVKFRDKLLHYPRLILGEQHPVLQENNCAAMKFFLDEAKDIRDAIVHANPRPDRSTSEPMKQLHFWRLGEGVTVTLNGVPFSTGMALCAHIVDNAILVVEEIETKVYGDLARLFWLHRREAGGTFSANVFD